MHIRINSNNLRNSEQVKAFAIYKEEMNELKKLEKSLQGSDDKVDIDLDPKKGDVAVNHLEYDICGNFIGCNTFTGYGKLNDDTGKLEELDGSFQENLKNRVQYKENEKDSIYERHSDTFNVDLKFKVDKETGDIDCHIK